MLSYKDIAIEIANKSPQEMVTLADCTDYFIEEVRKAHPQEVHKFLIGLKVKTMDSFDKDTAEEIVKEFTNKEGTIGQHWSYEDTSEVLKEKGYPFAEGDWYYMLNKVYCKLYEPTKSTESYIDHAKDILMMHDGKAKKYYMSTNY